MSNTPGLAPRYQRVLDPKTLDTLRQRFRGMNRWMLLIWRTGLGWTTEIWPAGFGRLMVIEHVGRKSGTAYRTPVNFTRRGPDLYCLAGFGRKTDWFQNVVAAPQIAVWLRDDRWTATAVDASDSPDRLQLMRSVLVDSGFASRAIGLDPRVADDDVLASATETYQLLRITPLQREESPEGPGDLAWVWRPIAAAFLVGWWLGRRGRAS